MVPRIIRVRYEKGVLKILDNVEFREGEELRVVILPKEFPEFIKEVDAEALGDVDRALQEARQRWKRWY